MHADRFLMTITAVYSNHLRQKRNKLAMPCPGRSALRLSSGRTDLTSHICVRGRDARAEVSGVIFLNTLMQAMFARQTDMLNSQLACTS